MTILQVASGTSGYGGERILLSLAKYLKKNGHRVIIVSPGKGEFVSMCHKLGHEVVVIPLRKTYDLMAALHISRLIKREKVDVVHSHGLLVNIISRVASCLSGCKIVNTIHVLQHLSNTSCLRRGASRRIRNIYYRTLDNATSRFCQKIITVSDAVKRDLLKQGLEEDKLLTIPNGIEENLLPLGKAIPLGASGGGDKDKIVGLVGRVVPLKGHDDFITCAKILMPSNPEIKFLIVGEDIAHGRRYLNSLKDRVKKEGLEDHVIFTGFLQSIRDVMADFNVLTLPSWEEPFGLVILEAMSLGVPVVATRSGGVPEIIKDGKNGLLIPPRSPEALSQAILKILNNKNLATRLAQEGLNTVKYYTAQRMAKSVEDVYRKVI